MPGLQRVSALCRVWRRNSTTSPKSGNGTRHCLPFSLNQGVNPSAPLGKMVKRSPTYSTSHARTGCLTGSWIFALSSSCSFNVLASPCTCCTVTSAPPLLRSWFSFGAASTTSSPLHAFLTALIKATMDGSWSLFMIRRRKPVSSIHSFSRLDPCGWSSTPLAGTGEDQTTFVCRSRPHNIGISVATDSLSPKKP